MTRRWGGNPPVTNGRKTQHSNHGAYQMKWNRKRRRVLKTIGVTVSGLSIAGCTAPSNGEDEGAAPGDEDTPTTTPTPSGDGEERVETDTVDMTDDLVFDPADIVVSSGTTVTWQNVGAIGHTVTAYEDEIPEDAEFFSSGGFDSEQAARDGYPDEGNLPDGATYEHTFEVTGMYNYFCIPHELNGMVGSVLVE